MSSKTLIQLGGIAAIIAGIFRGINSFLPNNASGASIEILYLIIDLLTLFGLMGLYGFQHEESRPWGFLFAIIGTKIII